MTIVICAYTQDRWPTLRRAIDMTMQQLTCDDELLIVVDHNEQLLGSCRNTFANCVTIPNRYHRGLSSARNSAVETAHGSIIVFLDDDAIPLEGWLDALRTAYADSRVYGVGGLAKPRWHGGRPGWFPEEFLWVVGCSYRGLPSVMQPVRNLIGANTFFP